MSDAPNIFNPYGDFNEGIFYPNVFSDEEKKNIQSHKMYWLALEIFTQTQGRVLITKSFDNVISLCTREGFWYGLAFYAYVDGNIVYSFEGATNLKERGKNRRVLESRKPAYLLKNVCARLKANLHAANRENSTTIENALGRLRRSILNTREASIGLTSEQEIAMMKALYEPSGRHAIKPEMDAALRAKYEHYLKEDADRQKQMEGCAEVFSEAGAWIVGVSETDILAGSASISFSKDEFYKMENAKLRRYASLDDVDPEIRDPLKLSLAMLKAHRGDRECYYIQHDKDHLFPIIDEAYPEYGAAMYCPMSRPSTHSRHWMVIAK